MTQQSQKQKDVNASAENEQKTGMVSKKSETLGFNTPNFNRTEPRTNLNPKMEVAQPEVGQTTRNDNAAAKEASPSYENGLEDAQAGRNPSEVRVDAKRDASPNQKPKLVQADQSRDK
jgi:hypothetical protein